MEILIKNKIKVDEDMYHDNEDLSDNELKELIETIEFENFQDNPDIFYEILGRGGGL